MLLAVSRHVRGRRNRTTFRFTCTVHVAGAKNPYLHTVYNTQHKRAAPFVVDTLIMLICCRRLITGVVGNQFIRLYKHLVARLFCFMSVLDYNLIDSKFAYIAASLIGSKSFLL